MLDYTNFMSIGSNSLPIAALGPDRLRGPVDNMYSRNGDRSLKSLFEGTILEELRWEPTFFCKAPEFYKDSSIVYRYKNFDVRHNYSMSDKFLEEFSTRLNRFNEFYSQVKKTKDMFFVYSLSESDKESSSKYLSSIQKVLDYLKSLDILDKTIFIGSKNEDSSEYWNFYNDSLSDKVHYIVLDNIPKLLDKEVIKLASAQFYKKVNNLKI